MTPSLWREFQRQLWQVPAAQWMWLFWGCVCAIFGISFGLDD